MNPEILRSKKFKAALVSSIGALLTIVIAKIGLGWNQSEIMTMVGAIMAPFIVYIGAEGYSEADAKRVAEESKSRKDLNNMVIDQILNQKKDDNNA